MRGQCIRTLPTAIERGSHWRCRTRQQQ
ncbi:hypothetical protein NC653_036996 [Populus alba x Populus x berolinensis]|uniref:Uncharacterized protein n=1 Tax=Populus alba x Populus x berolinensis TaxID=444605 RepID=A0AAD6LLK7_9ROSI|nr:hypothetical protein NC653_036996 [Populus alba x Populus x berolinensis]